MVFPIFTRLLVNTKKKVMARLLEAGADMHARSVDGWTPLLQSSRHGHLEIVELLLAYEGRAKRAGKRGRDTNHPPLQRNGAPSQWSLFGEEEEDDAGRRGRGEKLVDQTSRGGETAFWLACRWGHVHVAMRLLFAGADHLRRDRNWSLPEDVARLHGYDAILHLIDVRTPHLTLELGAIRLLVEGCYAVGSCEDVGKDRGLVVVL
jgi:hypothetical protein